jgi:hypothetical protein
VSSVSGSGTGRARGGVCPRGVPGAGEAERTSSGMSALDPARE